MYKTYQIQKNIGKATGRYFRWIIRTKGGDFLDFRCRCCIKLYATPHPNQATPHPTQLRRTILSYAAHWPRYFAPLLSYAAPCWPTPHSTELRPIELRRILLGYALHSLYL